MQPIRARMSSGNLNDVLAALGLDEKAGEVWRPAWLEKHLPASSNIDLEWGKQVYRRKIARG